MVLLSEDPVEKDSLGTHKMNTESIDRGESMKIKKTASTEDYS